MGISANMMFWADVDLVLSWGRELWVSIGSHLCWEPWQRFVIVSYRQLLFVLFIIMNNLYTCMKVLICGLWIKKIEKKQCSWQSNLETTNEKI